MKGRGFLVLRLFGVEVVFNGVSCVCESADRAVEYVKVQQRSPTANTTPNPRPPAPLPACGTQLISLWTVKKLPENWGVQGLDAPAS